MQAERVVLQIATLWRAGDIAGMASTTLKVCAAVVTAPVSSARSFEALVKSLVDMPPRELRGVAGVERIDIAGAETEGVGGQDAAKAERNDLHLAKAAAEAQDVVAFDPRGVVSSDR